MKKVAVIQDLSSLGKCSLTAAIPVLSVMGVQAVPLPTAVLTSQTDYPSFFCEDLTDKMHHFEEEWSKLSVEFDGIHTGFVTGEEQINHIFRFLDKFYQEKTMLLVDPVMGDRGEAYKMFTDALLMKMRELVKRADVIAPNVTECCLLTGLSYERLHQFKHEHDYIQAVEEAGRMLQQETGAQVIITGVSPPAGEKLVGNLYVNDEKTLYSAVPFNGASYSGTGDLFASVIMGNLMRGEDVGKGIRLAEEFLSAAIHDTGTEKVPKVAGVNFEKFLHMLM